MAGPATQHAGPCLHGGWGVVSLINTHRVKGLCAGGVGGQIFIIFLSLPMLAVSPVYYSLSAKLS